MKMLSVKMAILCAGIGTLGYLYLKKNPKMVDMMKNKVKDMGKDMSRQMYNKFDSEM